MKQKSKKVNKDLLYLISICFVVALLSFAIGILAVVFFLPFPERFEIQYMDGEMLAEGEGFFLVLIYLFGVLTALSLTGSIICTALSCYFNFYDQTELEIITHKNIWLTIGLMLFTIFASILPFVFVWFIPLIQVPNYQNVENYELEFNNILVMDIKSKLKLSKGIWISFISLLLAGLSAIAPAIMISMASFNPDVVPLRTQDLDDMYTLSRNKPNTITMYFDRGYGLFFNELLAVDYLLFKDKNESFIQKFPEFTSYLNTLSQSSVTNASNPMINGSWYQQPNFKNLDINDPFYGGNYKEQTMNQWYLNSYRNAFGMMSKYGYKNFGVYNVPYYDDCEWRRNGNGERLQEDLQTLANENKFYPLNNNLRTTSDLKFISMDNSESIKALGETPTPKAILDGIRTLRKLAAVNLEDNNPNPKNNDDISYGTNNNLTINGTNDYINLKVSSQKESTYLYLHFANTHEKYAYVQNQKSISKNNPYGINYQNIDDGTPLATSNNNEDFLVSVWYSIQKLKGILDYLKRLPYDGPHSDVIKNQYDNTNFYVISDHGNGIKSKKENLIKVQNFLVSNNLMSQKQNDYIINEYLNDDILSPATFNTVFMRKPAKYLNESQNRVNDFNTFFDSDKLIVNGDLYPIFEYDIYRQFSNNTNIVNFKDSDSWYFNSETNDIYKPTSNNPKIQEIIDREFTNNFLINPLSKKESNWNSRVVSLYGAHWMFEKNSKKFKLKYRHLYNPKYSGGIYNLKNFEKVKL